MSVEEGSDVILECELSKDRQVKWYRNGEKITANEKFVETSDGTKRYLMIKKIGADDAGSYQCVAENGEDTSATITITGKFKFFTENRNDNCKA